LLYNKLIKIFTQAVIIVSLVSNTRVQALQNNIPEVENLELNKESYQLRELNMKRRKIIIL